MEQHKLTKSNEELTEALGAALEAIRIHIRKISDLEDNIDYLNRSIKWLLSIADVPEHKRIRHRQ